MPHPYMLGFEYGRESIRNPSPPSPPPPPTEDEKIAAAVVEVLRQLPNGLRVEIISAVRGAFCVCGEDIGCQCQNDE